MRTIKYEPENFNLALVLVLSGLFKKIALSSYLSEHVVRQVFQVPESFSPAAVWAGIYGYSAQIYLDFSGYSDLALGLALLLGYNVGVNFKAPYLALSVREFWHRWHVSLSTWLRDYLYIPLGGNRHGRARKALNLFLTQLLGGLWHGAHLRYVLWGAVHGVALVACHFFYDRRRDEDRAAEAMGLKPWQRQKPSHPALKKALGFALTFHFVALAWVLFRAESVGAAWGVIQAAFQWGRPGAGAPPLAWAVIALTLLGQACGGAVTKAFAAVQERLPGPALAAWCAMWAVVILKLGPDGVLPFIYFQY